jgi:uncharacterized integral membrane protein
MIRFLKGLVLLPVAILVVLLAVANRDAVRLSFDPFSPEAPVFSLTLPLYAILFVAVALGIVVGGIGAWLGQGETRRKARERRREIRRDADRLRYGGQPHGPAGPALSPGGPAGTSPNTERREDRDGETPGGPGPLGALMLGRMASDPRANRLDERG